MVWRRGRSLKKVGCFGLKKRKVRNKKKQCFVSAAIISIIICLIG